MRPNESDDAALDGFIVAEWAGLLVALRLTCGPAADVEGALAEAVARAWEQRRDRAIRNLRGWVLTVALNEVRSQARRTAVASRYQERVRPLLHDAAGTDGANVDLLRALDHLTRRQREAVVLYYWGDLSTAAVGRSMGISADTVKALLHQGRAALAPQLGIRHDHAEEISP